MEHKAEILCVGTELLMGEIANTNAQFISETLSGLGINVFWHSVVGDNPARLREALRIAHSRADIILTTGGLGPTYDDLTKDTIADFFGRSLVYHPEIEAEIRRYCASVDRAFTENNLRQAWLPEGCTIFENGNGTAPGCGMAFNGTHIIMLPGPPSEMRLMLQTGVVPYLRSLSDGILLSHSINLFGLGESVVEDILHSRMLSLTNPTLAPYAKTGEVRLRVSAKAENEDAAERLIAPVIAEVRELLGDVVYGVDETSLESLCLKLLKAKGLTFSSAESCTGGLIAKRITDIPGASEVFSGSVVSYTNAVKQALLSVPASVLDCYGAVSWQTAVLMAEGVRRRIGTDIAVSVTGVCGPSSDDRGTPVGTAFVGFSADGVLTFRKINMGYERERGRTVAAHHAFDMIRRYLQGLPLNRD